jgi:hypothetical protein
MSQQSRIDEASEQRQQDRDNNLERIADYVQGIADRCEGFDVLLRMILNTVQGIESSLDRHITSREDTAEILGRIEELISRAVEDRDTGPTTDAGIPPPKTYERVLATKLVKRVDEPCVCGHSRSVHIGTNPQDFEYMPCRGRGCKCQGFRNP